MDFTVFYFAAKHRFKRAFPFTLEEIIDKKGSTKLVLVPKKWVSLPLKETPHVSKEKNTKTNTPKLDFKIIIVNLTPVLNEEKPIIFHYKVEEIDPKISLTSESNKSSKVPLLKILSNGRELRYLSMVPISKKETINVVFNLKPLHKFDIEVAFRKVDSFESFSSLKNWLLDT